MQADGKILIGGAFSSFNGIPSPGLARVNTEKFFLSTPKKSPDGTIQFDVSGEIGRQWEIQASTNLVTWTFFTSLTSSNGTMQITDPETNGHRQKYYRAVMSR